jgi:diguanylate cyclase (GGDEF)-like protein
MFGDLRGVLRIANIDLNKVKPGELTSTFASLTPLFAAALERALISQENQRRKTQLAAISGITQTINRTLDLKEICAACARHLLPVLGYNHLTMVRYVKGDDISVIVALPREIRFAESAATSRIMIRNLCAPKQPLLIENLQRSDKVECRNKTLGSLIAVPLYVGGKPFASVVLTSPPERTYDTDDMNVLATLAEHISVTLERAVHFKRQEDLATRDGLTGLYNHRVFQEHLKAELDRLVRYKRPFSVVLLDIDHFKQFNDTYGHQTGDVVLRSVAQSLRSSCRATDAVFRYGGEEFCAILPETSLKEAALFARRLNAAVRDRAVATQHGDLRVTVSVGVAQAGGETAAADAVVEAADKAMYHAKQTGRDRVSLYREGKIVDANG